MIVSAAISSGGAIHQLPRPARHADIRHALKCDGEPGFLDDAGRFLRRKAAAMHAVKAGQVKREAVNWNLGLFTEDLW